MREKIAVELFYEDWDREHTVHLVDSGNWDECPDHIKEVYYKEADVILSLITKEIEEMELNWISKDSFKQQVISLLGEK